MSKKKIVFVNQAAGYITIDIVNAFVPHFSDVALIYGDLRVQDVPLSSIVKTSKVIEKTRRSNLARFIRWSIASIQIFFLLITQYRRYEIFYFTLPPFAYFSSLFIRRKFSLLVFDVYPDALKIVNIGEQNLLYRAWKNINRRLFKKTHRIYTIGDGLARQLKEYTDNTPIKVIPLWTGLKNISPIPKKNNRFISQHQLEDKFIVQYSGNIGPGIHIETLLEVAKIMRHNRNILFQIIGRGAKMNTIERIAKDKQLENLLILPFQPDDLLKFSLAAADLGVVILDDRLSRVSIPSKVYNLIATGIPILSISSEESELTRLVNDYDVGKTFRKDEAGDIANFISEMYADRRKLETFGKNSLSASVNHTSANAGLFVKDYLTQ